MQGNGEGRTQRVSIEAVRRLIFTEAGRGDRRDGRLSVRQIDRVAAMTGATWSNVNEEAEREGL